MVYRLKQLNQENVCRNNYNIYFVEFVTVNMNYIIVLFCWGSFMYPRLSCCSSNYFSPMAQCATIYFSIVLYTYEYFKKLGFSNFFHKNINILVNLLVARFYFICQKNYVSKLIFSNPLVSISEKNS